MDLEGRLLGNRYEIKEKIGNGGMAMVYKAKDQVLNRFVAIKILRDEFTTDEEFIKRFSIEAQSAASITHPNIVSVYDVGNEGNLYYIVMELIKGKTLKEIIIEEGGALPWKWSTNIAIQIAAALETAHRNNIIHRDIKPHNIIITEDGIAKVTDFGIAKAVSNSTITAFGSTIGSVHYFSPEHAKGGYTDSKSDLYSLGVVMYEMLTGKVPFDADTPVSVALKHMQEEPVAPKDINDKIPNSLNDIILKAMRKDPTLRYQSATEMLRDLNRALKDPNGDFVDNASYSAKEGATRVIPTLNNEEIVEENYDDSDESWFAQHKKLAIGLIVFVLFILSIFGTNLILRLTQPKETAIPNIVGISKEEAEKKITDNKLVIGEVKEEYNSEYEAGYVISQDPAYRENYNIKEGSKINYVVSLGIEEATVPRVVGKTEEEAIKLLEEAKLKYEIKEENSKKIEAGYVIEQETDPDKTVNAGDTVVIHVSLGVKKITAPSVLGKSEKDATKELKNAGFKVIVTTKEDTSKDNDTVLKQSIDAGTEVEDESSITITVNKIVQTKTANLTINVKSILGNDIVYEDITTGEGESTETTKVAKDVNVKITVNDETPIYNKKTDPTTTNLAQPVTGKGTVTVKIYIDDILYNTTQINLNETKKLTIDKRN